MKQILTILLLFTLVTSCKKQTTSTTTTTTTHPYAGDYDHDWITPMIYSCQCSDVTSVQLTHKSGNTYTISNYNHYSPYSSDVTFVGNRFDINTTINDARGKWHLYGFATITGKTLAFNYKADTATYDTKCNNVHTQTYTKK